MGLTESVKTCLTKKYCTFSGRATRSEYWWFVFFEVIGTVIIAFLLGAIFGAEYGVVFYLITPILLLLPALSVMVRRLHDTGHSGWWYFINLIPLVGGIVFLVLMLKGSGPDNQYGPNPLA